MRAIVTKCGFSPGCGDLSNPKDGSVSTDKTTVGGTATYSCNTGFELDGDTTRTCQNDRNWNGSAPLCIAGMSTL